MESIVFLERSTFNIEFRRPAFLHDWSDFAETPLSEIVPRLRSATIAICNKLPLRADTLRHLPALKLIAVAATGVDNVDLDFWQMGLPFVIHAVTQSTLCRNTH